MRTSLNRRNSVRPSLASSAYPPSSPVSTTLHCAGVAPYWSIGSHTISTCTSPWMHSITRTSRWSASKSVGARVWLEPSLLSCHSPIVSPSTTRSHPWGVIQVVSIRFVPGT